MANLQPDQIRYPKPRPKLVNRFGGVLILLSGIYALVTHFLTVDHFAVTWGPYLAFPFGLLGLYFALQRRAQVLHFPSRELLQTKEILRLTISKKAQSFDDFSRVRLSEDELEINGRTTTVYRLFLEGKVTPALLDMYTDKNEATQRLKCVAKLVELPISWPQV